LAGLENLSSIGGSLDIGGGGWNGPPGNSSLSSLSGLENLTSISGWITIVDNNSLTSLTGLDNIQAESISDLVIYGNISLSSCEVQSICDYLVAPSGKISIYSNATGCNTQQEVEVACETVSVEEINLADNISIYPNPAKDILTISCKYTVTIEMVVIYNQMGQKVLEIELVNNTIDLSNLQLGMYIIEVVSGQQKIREKLMIY